jgi:hypothetical protein
MVRQSLCVSHIVISLTYHPAHVKSVCKGATFPPPLSLHTPPPPPCIILLHYELVVTDFPFSPAPFFNPVSQKRLWFFGNNVSGLKSQGYLLLQRGLIMLSFSETFFLKMTQPIAVISQLVFCVQK